MNDSTIIYYTANREDERVERRAQETILKNSGGLPIISVSQKPIDFGQNICVGEQPYCDATAHRQLLIGLQAAKTKYAIAAESDCLYPPEYFAFTPPTDDNVYRYDNIWIMYQWVGPGTRGVFWKKPLCEGAQICNREYWIKAIEHALRSVNGWELKRPRIVFRTGLQFSFTGENPVISIKSTKGLRKYAGTYKIRSHTLPLWGDVSILRNDIFKDK